MTTVRIKEDTSVSGEVRSAARITLDTRKITIKTLCGVLIMRFLFQERHPSLLHLMMVIKTDVLSLLSHHLSVKTHFIVGKYF